MEKAEVMKIVDKIHDNSFIKKQLLKSNELLDNLSLLDKEKVLYGLKIINTKSSLSYKIKALNFIKDLENNFSAFEACEVLSNETIIDAGTSIEGAKVIIEAEKPNMAYFMHMVLSSKIALKAGVAIKGAELIGKFNNSFNANLASSLFYNKDVVSSGIVLDVVKILKNSKEKYQAVKIFETFYDKELIKVLKEKNLISALDIINESKNRYNAIYATDVLNSISAINAGIAVEGAKLINEIDIEFKAESAMVAQMLCDKRLIKKEDVLGEVRKIVNELKEREKFIKKKKA